jgi:DNA polymerase III subunit gamma/tau
VGKTTTARILARALNCVKGPTPEPCGKCDACIEIAEGRDLDVLEIDAATHTGVDAVREVIVEPLSIAPMRGRYKIFIIDEVHRLSKQAFDALLKSIEEPPPYVKFMMATTDLHSVPATIQSRSQVFELKTLSFNAIRDQLKQVTTREKVKVDDAALALVARAAEGSMRDALSSLDQVLAFTSDAVTAVDVSTVLGLIGRDAQFDIAEIVAREDAAGAFAAAAQIVEAGFRPARGLPGAGPAHARPARGEDRRVAPVGSGDRRGHRARPDQGAGRPVLARRSDAVLRPAVARRVRHPPIVAAAPSVRDVPAGVDSPAQAHAAHGVALGYVGLALRSA